ncbi:MAG: ATP-binding protein [Terrimicrobiaceae bacterium]
MIQREIGSEMEVLLREYPVLTILGPRQAGKTTLARSVCKEAEYTNLEIPETRDFAISDPKAFLAQFSGQVIIDEIQRVPSLLSYIQGIVDAEKINGRFILTGSHQLELRGAVSQSLAGRTALLNLLPFSIGELASGGVVFDQFEEYAFRGFLPRIYDQNLRPTVAWSNYYQTYVERDVRQLIDLKNAALFEKFMKLLAGRVGQLIDYSSLANDVGVDAKTVRSWLSILEASFLIFKLPPYFENFGKRVVKSPKYYFTDVGLLCFLLGIREPEQVTRDPLVGSIFENLVVLEFLKSRWNQGRTAAFYFFRDSNEKEVDLLMVEGREFLALEIKSCSTFHKALLKGISRIKKLIDPHFLKTFLVYNGLPFQCSDGTVALPFRDATKNIEEMLAGGRRKS